MDGVTPVGCENLCWSLGRLCHCSLPSCQSQGTGLQSSSMRMGQRREKAQGWRWDLESLRHPLSPPSWSTLGASGKRVVEALCSEEDEGKGKEIVVARSYPWLQVWGEQLVGQTPVLGIRESVVDGVLSPVKALDPPLKCQAQLTPVNYTELTGYTQLAPSNST